MNRQVTWSLRVFAKHAVALWSLLGAVAVSAWCFLWWLSASRLAAPKPDTLLFVWRLFTLTLAVGGARWAIITVDISRRSSVLQPGRRRSAAQAAIVAGSVVIATWIAAGVLLAWLCGAQVSAS